MNPLSRGATVPSTSTRKVVVSLHDVTPFHFPRLLQADALFREMGMEKVTCLLIPQYHGGNRCDESADFIEWCRAAKPYSVDWCLHGHDHIEAPDSSMSQQSWVGRIKKHLLTAGEAEFLTIDHETRRAKLQAGRKVFRNCLAIEPKGFVAPAWMFDVGLLGLLEDIGFKVTEDHHRIYFVDRDQAIRSPVITWATRTPLRKYGAVLVAPLLAALWRREPAVRVALHPFDFDHEQTVNSIRRVLGEVLRDRDQAFAHELGS